MKAFVTLCVTVLVTIMINAPVHAQHQRMVLFEEFTAMTCPPCATAKPKVEEFAKTPNVITVTYHQNYPAPGDPYYTVNAPDARTRHDWYGVKGIPDGYMDGVKQVYPGDLAAMSASAATDLAKSSPLLITVTEDRNKAPWAVHITVKNDGSAALNNMTLHTLTMNYHADLTGWSVVSGNANKQYTVFDDCFIGALPSINGTSFNIAAGEEKSFDFVYQMGTPEQIWTSPYIVAFVQDMATKDVIQAGTSFVSATQIKADISWVENFGRIAANTASFKQKIKVSNPTTSPLKVILSVDANSSSIPAGWTATVDQGTVTIDAGANLETYVTISSNATAGFAKVHVVCVPQVSGSGMLALPTNTDVYALSSNAKVAVLSGFADATVINGTYLSALNAKYANLSVAMNGSADVISHYDISNFDVIVLPIDSKHKAALSSTDNKDLVLALMNAMEKSKRLIICSETDVFTAFRSGTAESKQLFTKYFGISGISQSLSIPRVNLNGSGIVTAVLPYKLNPISADELGSKLAPVMTNIYNTSYPYYNLSTDPLMLNSSGTGKAFLVYESENLIAGVRAQTDVSRAIFMSFSPDAIPGAVDRQTLLKSCLDWVAGAISAQADIKITAGDGTSPSVDFGTIKVNDTKTAVCMIKNTGAADLVISSMDIDAAYASTMHISPSVTFPLSIPAGTSKNIDILFKPKQQEDVVTTCTVHSNAKTAANGESIFLISATVSGVSSDVADDLMAQTLTLTPNPTSAGCTLKCMLPAGSNQPPTISIVDAMGNIVSMLKASTPQLGVLNMQIDMSDMAAGWYRICVSSGAHRSSAPLLVVHD